MKDKMIDMEKLKMELLYMIAFKIGLTQKQMNEAIERCRT